MGFSMTVFDSSKLEASHLRGMAGFKSRGVSRRSTQHRWVTVVNPSNQRLLLQACDDCGVVKSENSVVKQCLARKGKALITNALRESVRLVS